MAKRRKLVPDTLSMTLSISMLLGFIILIRMFDINLLLPALLHEFKTAVPTYILSSFIVLFSDIVSPIPAGIIIYTNAMVLGIFGGFLLSLISLLCSAIAGYYFMRISTKYIRLHRFKKRINRLPPMNFYILILSKVVPGISELVIFWCGINNFDIKKFIFGNLLAYIPICLFYSFFGGVESEISMFWFSFMVLITISFIIYAYVKMKAYLKQKVNLNPFV